MQLQYADADNTTIQVTLDEGETLGNHQGPAVLSVPVAPGNAEYEAILASGQPIAPYRAPVAPTIYQSQQSLALRQARSLNSQGRTQEALDAILSHLGG